MKSKVVRDIVYIQAEKTKVELCQLKKDETYLVQAVTMGTCQPMLELSGYGLPPQSIFNFVATASCQTLSVYADMDNPDCQGLMYLSVSCITCIDELSPAGGLNRVPIGVVPGVSPQVLVEDIFIGGGCFDVSGITYNGSPMASGSFINGMTSIGLSSGVILTTGSASLATGPNNTGSAGATSGGGSDPDLVQAGGSNVFDAAILQFQFTPTEPQVTFRYVFGSEEYCEYANSTFNDVFGFFLSGPGISGPYSNNAANIAVLPGGLNGIPVSINNVNHVNNPAFYVSNIPAGQPNCQGHPDGNPPATLECQYDGFTKVLTAVANVIPCQTYTIKIAIGDGGDTNFDSGVFLEGNSFDGGGNATVTAVVPFTQSDLAYEGCTPAHFLFTRGGAIGQPLTIHFTISGTATPGVDYATLPTSITIPANQATFQLPVNIFADQLPEGIETITLSLSTPCSCTTNSATLQISDLPPINVSIPDQTVCAGMPVQIPSSVSGGVAPYTYAWSPSGSGPTYVGAVQQSGTYTVTVTDYCGTTASASAFVNAYNLSATISGTASVCDGGGPGYLTVNFNGPGPWTIFVVVNGASSFSIPNITQNPYQLPVFQPGVYTIIAVTNNVCFGTGAGQGIVQEVPFNLTAQVDNPSCFGLTDGAIDLSVSGGASPYSYSWGNNVNTQDIQNLGAGTYTVTVTDGQGCKENLAVQVTQPPQLQASVNTLSVVDCVNPTGGSLELLVSGGTAAYTFLWNTGDTLQDLSGLTAGAYSVTVTDANNCLDTASAVIQGDTNIPTADIQAFGQVNCLNSSLTLDGSASSGGPGFVYSWAASGGGLITGSPDEWITTAEGAGVYELTVTDTVNNCYTIASVVVQANLNSPLANPGADQVINCYESEVVLDGSGSSAGANISYAWTTQTGNFTSPADIPSPTADAPGLYTLIVTNATNGCSDTAEVLVTTDLALPSADAGVDGTLDCASPIWQLGGSGTSQGGNITYQWTTIDGNIDGDPNAPAPSADQAGTYLLTVTNVDNGCSETDEAAVLDLIVLPAIQIETPELLTCAVTEINLDAGNSESGPAFTFSWTPLNGGAILSGEDTPTPLVSETGYYQLVLTNTATGCQSIDSVEVMADLVPPVADAGAAQVIGCDLPDTPLDGSGSSAGPQISYAWAAVNGGNIVSGANTASPLVNSVGDYILTVFDAGNGCTAQDTMQVVLDGNTPQAVATASQLIDCAHPSVSVSGIGSSLGPNFTYLWTTSGGNIVSGNGTLFLSAGAAGTYTLTVANQLNGCSSQADVVVGVDTLAPTVQLLASETLTCATTEIVLSGTGSSTGPAFSSVWTTTDGNILSDPSALDIQADQPGLYALTVTNLVNGCVQSAETEVFQDIDLPLAAAASPGVLTCGTTELSLSGAGSSAGPAFSYSWSTTGGNILAGGASLSPLVNEPGVYEILVLNTVNGCSAASQVAVGQDISPPQAVALVPDVLTCSLPLVALDGGNSTGTGPLLYQWTTLGGNFAGPADIASPLVDTPGTYTLVATSAVNLCSDTVQVSVAQNITAPVADAGPAFELDCGQTSLSLDGAGSSSGPFYTYSWSTANGILLGGENTLAPLVGAAGVYVLTVADQENGCSSQDQAQVTLDADAPMAVASAPQPLTCAVSQVGLNGAGSSQGPEFTYLWTTANGNIVSGNTTLSPEASLPGTYILTVTNLANSCASSSSVVVLQNIAPPLAQAGASATITCADTEVSLNGGGSSQGPGFLYAWTAATGNIVSGANSLTPLVDQPGEYVLLVTNTSNGCTASDPVNVDIDQVPPIVVLQTPGLLTCATTQLNLGAAGTSAGPGFTYQWATLGGNIAAGGNTLSPEVDAPGTYILTVENGQNGCAASESVVVGQDIAHPVANASASALLTCQLTQLQLNGGGSSTGAGFSYQWAASDGGVIQSGAESLTPTIIAPGTYAITVLNGANGCASTAAVIVAQDITPPVALIGSPPSLTCLDSQVSLNASGSSFGAGYTLTWSASGGGNIVSAANALQPVVNQPGQYTLHIMNENNGCSSSAAAVVAQTIDPPGASAGPGMTLHCNLPVAQLQGASPIGAAASYVWTTANGAIVSGSNTPNPSVGAPGLYELTVTNPANGCISTAGTTVTESVPAAFDYVSDPPVCKGFPGYIQFGQVLGGTPPYQFSISGGATFSAQTFYPNLGAGDYDLVVRDANGCDLYDEAVLAPGADVEMDVEREVFLNLGEDYQVQVFINVDESDILSIHWTPDLFLSCNDCLTPLVAPTQSVDYLVTIVTKEGCEGEARISFRVKKQANVFVPNIFSPNGDGENDAFMIFAGNQVAKVNSFMIFDRWGEPVYENFGFLPNDPAYSWDGYQRGQLAGAGVYVWYAEIEMLDGRTEVFKGSVSLVR